MGFVLFLLVTASLLVRPWEQFPDLRNLHIYEGLILLCLACSVTAVLGQFTVKSLEANPISIGVFGLPFAIVLSHLSNGNMTSAGESGLEAVKILVYYVLLVGNVTTTARMRAFLATLGISGVIFVSMAVLQYHDVIETPEPEVNLATYDKNKYQYEKTGAFVVDKEYDPVTGQMIEYRRLRGLAGSIFGDPNDMCLLLTMTLFIALYGMTDRRQGVLCVLWLGCAVFMIYALSLTHSRGGFLALLAGCMALFHARFGWRGTLLLGPPLVLGAAIVFAGRMASISATEGTGQTRIQLWSDCMAALKESPVFGVGMNGLGSAIGMAAHNSFLSAYAELGVVGGTMFFGAFFFALVTILHLLRYREYVADAELRRMLPFLAAMLASYSVGILSLSRVEAVPTYMLLAMITVAANLAATYAPALSVRLDGRLMQRLALTSVSFLAVCYAFVRVFRA